jgi:uncharacterized protein (TIGR02284 family)
MDTDALDKLKTLHTHAIDARHGYEEALDDAEGRGLTSLFREMIALHETNADELSAWLVSVGAPVNDDGSFMSVVHRTIIRLRSLFNGLDESVLPGLIDGEERNRKSYAETLEMPALPADVRNLLTRQRDRIDAAISGMRLRQRSCIDPNEGDSRGLQN